MKSHVDARYLLGLGALFLWGCPIDDAKFKEPAGTSSSSSSSSGSESSSSSTSSSSSSSGNGGNAGNGGAGGMGGVGGNGGAAGMGGAVTSSSSSSSSGGGMGGAAGMGGSGGGGPVCPDPGTVGSCGTPNCPPCPKLVMIGTGMIDGTAATFESGKGWTTATVVGMKSDYPPAFAIRTGKNEGVAVFRNTTTGFLYHLGYAAWNAGNGFGMVNDVDGGNALVDTSPVVAASADAVHVAFLEIGNGDKYRYAQYNNSNWTPPNEIVQNMGASLGYCAPGLTVTGSNVVLLNPGWMNDDALYNRIRGAAPAGTWDAGYKYMSIMQVVDDVTPAIVPLGGGPTMLIVFTEKTMNKPLFSLTGSGTTWTNPVMIPASSSIEVTLLPLSAGEAILVYRHYTTNAIFWSRFDGATWSTVKEIPGGLKAKSKPTLAVGAGDAEVELLFMEETTSNAHHARLRKGAMNFDPPTSIMGTSGLVGIAAATNL